MASSGNVKLHRTVLNRCLPDFVKDLDFNAVLSYIYSKELFDDITLRDISDEKTTSEKIRHLIHRIQQRDEGTYEKFKDCLVQSKQEHLKKLLEEEEEKVDNTKGTARGKDNVTVTKTTRKPVASKSEVFHDKTSNDNVFGAPKYSSAIPIHHSRSSNAVLEETGDKYNNTFSLISPMSSVSLQGTDYILKEHFDACIIYCEADENDVYNFKDHLKKLDLGLGEHPKICLYTEENVWGPTKLIERPKFVCKHCTLIFVYLSKRCSVDEYADFFRNEVIMATMKNCRVRPVLSEKDCDIPYGLRNAPRIEWYRQESRSYKENIQSLFLINKSDRLKREAERIESKLSTL
ncbi:hypothetical protein CHS0354_016102 [Potamilus streckersoni]|uniref:CARD domain-containing protein n=1 Tax=Potamilus streckersoni TaxID=2493646 RepID=A0AAE0W670_9BIVA|nr:hypothetical protein CHS0354_016102 [Potamilus streckersoni]